MVNFIAIFASLQLNLKYEKKNVISNWSDWTKKENLFTYTIKLRATSLCHHFLFDRCVLGWAKNNRSMASSEKQQQQWENQCTNGIHEMSNCFEWMVTIEMRVTMDSRHWQQQCFNNQFEFIYSDIFFICELKCWKRC